MLKKFLFPCFAAILLASCNSTFQSMQADTNAKNVHIGMTEKEVVQIMGKHYEIVGAAANTRVIKYNTADVDYEYRFLFVNNRLESFSKERVPQSRPHVETIRHTSINASNVSCGGR